MTKIAPVTRRAHFSNWTSFLNALLTHWLPRAISTAKTNTGTAVPGPYADGNSTLEPFLTASGSRLPKKSAADTGQKDRAKRIPSKPAPQDPDFPMRSPALSLTQDVAKLKRTNPRRTIPVAIRTGPRNLFIYVESQKDKSGMAKTLAIKRAASTA